MHETDIWILEPGRFSIDFKLYFTSYLSYYFNSCIAQIEPMLHKVSEYALEINAMELNSTNFQCQIVNYLRDDLAGCICSLDYTKTCYC